MGVQNSNPRGWRKLSDSEVDQVAGGAWDLFYSWGDLQFRNYSISEQFEDGSIGAWLLEDWEIYGQGAGGYTSSGPYGNWQADIQVWLQNGSMLAHDIINWNASQLQSHNISTATQQAAQSFDIAAMCYVNGMPYWTGAIAQDSSPTFGPPGSAAEYEEGEIVVTAAYRHADNSMSYHFASYDPYTHQPVSWVQNVSFLDQNRAEADARAITFDPQDGITELTPEETAATERIEAQVSVVIGWLQTLSSTGFFTVQGVGRITVAELITLLARADWKIYPDNTFNNGGVGATQRNLGDPIFKIERDDLVDYADPNNPAALIYYLLHETSHATRAMWEERNSTGGVALEVLTNDVARAIAAQTGHPFPQNFTPTHGYGSTSITYSPNSPGI